MPQNFIECDREQVLLMAPSLRDWLPEDHFVWFVVAAVDEMDLGAGATARTRETGGGDVGGA